jgi:hypothetical protein
MQRTNPLAEGHVAIPGSERGALKRAFVLGRFNSGQVIELIVLVTRRGTLQRTMGGAVVWLAGALHRTGGRIYAGFFRGLSS